MSQKDIQANVTYQEGLMEKNLGTRDLSESLKKSLLKRARYWNERAEKIEKAGQASLILNFLVGLIKVIIGVYAHSLAIRTDGVKGMTDALSSFITILSARYSNKAPDEKHPSGYGRIEYIGTILTAVVTLGAGWALLTESWDRILHPQASSVTDLQIAIIALTILVKIHLYRADKKIGTDYNSKGLITDARSDFLSIFSTILVVVNALSSRYLHIDVDGWIGMALAILILYAGIDCFRGSISSILDAPVSSELFGEVQEIFKSCPPILNASNLRLCNHGGGRVTGTLSILVPVNASAIAIYQACEHAKEEVLTRFGILLTCGILVTNAYEDEIRPVYQKVDEALGGIDGILGIDAFNYDPEAKTLDLTLAVSYDVLNRDGFLSQISGKIAQILPDASLVMSLDLDGEHEKSGGVQKHRASGKDETSNANQKDSQGEQK